ncbi:hypothetical protein AA313_de0206175 [Arthrobotrys entomopaga]|nr:hypothetical protein AA313_de0206175 [Arthrobotrys entomopaga]
MNLARTKEYESSTYSPKHLYLCDENRIERKTKEEKEDRQLHAGLFFGEKKKHLLACLLVRARQQQSHRRTPKNKFYTRWFLLVNIVARRVFHFAKGPLGFLDFGWSIQSPISYSRISFLFFSFFRFLFFPLSRPHLH